MIRRRHAMVTTLATLGFLAAVVSTASAEEPRLYDWGSEKAPVLVTNSSGVIFLGSDRGAWRAYSWEKAEDENKESVYLPKLDNDSGYDVVGAGTPTFAIDTDSNPWWSIEEGCRQVIVANFAASERPDVMCNQGTKIKIFTHDRQKVWALDLGVELDFCKAGDINGDLKADIECQYAGRDAWIRLDGTGKILAQSTEESEIPKDAVDLDQASPVSKEVWTGKREFDLNGDGTKGESIVAEGSTLEIQSDAEGAGGSAEVGGEIVAALVKNLDGKGKPEIVALTDSEIVVFDPEGERLGSYSADAGEYSRYPVADIKNAYARNFADNDKASEVVQGAKEEFARCYEERVEGKLIVGTGEIILKTHVGEDGGVDRIEQIHSAINDDKVEKCAKDVLRGLEYPKPAKTEDGEGRKAAKLNVTLEFTFADKT